MFNSQKVHHFRKTVLNKIYVSECSVRENGFNSGIFKSIVMKKQPTALTYLLKKNNL